MSLTFDHQWLVDRPPLPVPGKLFTIADLNALPVEVPSGPVDYELDNGRLITVVPPGDAHGAAQARLCSELIVQGDKRGLGATRTEVGVVLWRGPDRLVGPDVAFILKRSLPVRRSPEGYLETIPELVVEIVSKNDTQPFLDREIADYLAAGVQLALVADPESKTIIAYRPGGAVQTFNEHDTLTLDGILPEFRCAVAELFAA